MTRDLKFQTFWAMRKSAAQGGFLPYYYSRTMVRELLGTILSGSFPAIDYNFCES
jgi:hypothetical protein